MRNWKLKIRNWKVEIENSKLEGGNWPAGDFFAFAGF